MIKIELQKQFRATPEKLWELIVDPDYYRFWTKGFHEGSDFVGDWTKGSKMRFISLDDNYLESGMLSEVAESIYPEFISIRHVGLVMAGIEDYDSFMVKKWTPSFENYRLTAMGDGSTHFFLEQDVPEEEADDFIAMWEKSFELMKELLDKIEGKPSVITLRSQSQYSAAEIWERLVNPEKVMLWNYASEEWHCPRATIDLRIGGEFHWEMAAKDGSMAFDFAGKYTGIEEAKRLAYALDDGRKVEIEIFETEAQAGCRVEERFEAEHENSLYLQRLGWQNILKNLVG